MKQLTHIAIVGALALGVSGLVLVDGTAPSMAQHSGHSGHSSHATKPTDSPSTVDYRKAHVQMMKDMEITYTNNSDMDFVRGMIPHHQGAIAMAKVQLAHGKDAEIRALAERIIADQEKEIAQMQGWLKKNAK